MGDQKSQKEYQGKVDSALAYDPFSPKLIIGDDRLDEIIEQLKAGPVGPGKSYDYFLSQEEAEMFHDTVVVLLTELKRRRELLR